MNNELYKDIAPYENEDAHKATEYILSHPEFLEKTLRTLYKKLDKKTSTLLKNGTYNDADDLIRTFLYTLGKVNNWKEFQEQFVRQIIMPLVIDSTTDGFTVSGLEKIDTTKPHIFVSNHRDIILDSAFLVDAILSKNGLPVKVTAGSNLYINREAECYFGLLGCVKVFRGLSLREEYEASLKLSSYVYDTIDEGKSSLWIAGSAGRSKDGVDRVLPSVIKMLILSHRKDMSLSDLVQKLSIVPMSISYEKNPNDVNMAEEIVKTIKTATYKKKPLEDFLSIIRGICCYKGRVHIAFSPALSGTFNSTEEIASRIEKDIRLSYKLYPFAFYAYDKIHKTDRFKSMYTELQEEKEAKRFKYLKHNVNKKVLEAYAAPIDSKLLYK